MSHKLRKFIDTKKSKTNTTGYHIGILYAKCVFCVGCLHCLSFVSGSEDLWGRIGRCGNLRFFMNFIDENDMFGNYELLEKPIASFMAASDTPEELWQRVERWLESEIFGTDKAILSHFETPFEKRVLQLLLERKHPLILFTYRSTDRGALHELNISPTNAQCLVLSYRPSPDAPQCEQTENLRMAVINLADEFVSIGATSDNNILSILDLHRQSPQKPLQML